MNIFRRLPLSRLLLLCALVVAVGASATAIASALGGGAKPAAKPLAQAVHDALVGTPVQGVSANITYTNHLLEGANLASGDGGAGGGGGQAGELASSPLVSGASGRLWASNGRVRLELQSDKGDMQVIYDGHTVSIYDAANNTVYRYTPKQEASSSTDGTSSAPDGITMHNAGREVPSVAKIEEAIAHVKQHVNLSEATPTDVAGQPAYTVRVSPKESGSLIGGAELSFDAAHGLPLRTAIYSSTSSSPVIELAATEVSYGAVDSSLFSLTPPPNAKIEDISAPTGGAKGGSSTSDSSKPALTTHGSGVNGIAVLESKVTPGTKSSPAPEGLPKVKINGATASELKTALGTILTFERSGVRYVVAGAQTSSAIEAFAKGL